MANPEDAPDLNTYDDEPDFYWVGDEEPELEFIF